MLQYAGYELRRHGIAHAHGGLVGRSPNLENSVNH